MLQRMFQRILPAVSALLLLQLQDLAADLLLYPGVVLFADSSFRSLDSKRAIFVFAFIFCTSFRQKNTRLSQTITGRTRHLLQTGKFHLPYSLR